MPSRVIISSVNRKTPANAAPPVFIDDECRRPSMSFLIRFAVRHMCTVSEATDTAATNARTPSHKAWFLAWKNSQAAPMLRQRRRRDAPMNRRNQLGAVALAQIRQADGDDEERFEAFAKSDDKRLQHMFGKVRLESRFQECLVK